MFITEAEIEAHTGYEVTRNTLNIAQMMIEAFIGKSEEEVEDAKDKSLLAQAVTFQAIYLAEDPDSVLQQPSAIYQLQGGSSVSFDVEKFAPFISPWAFKACERLSWHKSRSIHTGKAIQNHPYSWAYAWTHDTEELV